MKRKIWITIIAVVFITALGATVALAADDEGTWRGSRRFENREEMIDKLVEDSLLTQAQADSILDGDAHISDYINREDIRNQNSDGFRPRGRKGGMKSSGYRQENCPLD